LAIPIREASPDDPSVPTATRALVPLLLAAVLLVPLAGSASATEPPHFDQATLTQARTDVVTLINGKRASAGLRALQVDPALMAVAQARAEVMAATDILSHTEPDGTKAADRVAAAGLTWSAIGEIIAWNNYLTEDLSASQAVMLWTMSPGHYDIMMSTTYTRFGIGAADSASGKHYYAGVFIASGSAATTLTDTTRPWVRVSTPTRTILDRYRSRIRTSWVGGDVRSLVGPTSGLRYYQVQRRIVGRSWGTATTTTLTTTSFIAARRHTWEIRVRSRDHAGNWSAWHSVRIWA
jgi:uncharacterized protein YkwD